MDPNRLARIVIYGLCTALALVATLIWSEHHYPYIVLGIFGIRLFDAIWKER